VYSRQESKVRCYQDGRLVGETDYGAALAHSGDLYFGGANLAGDDGGFKGLISDLRIYNRALTTMDVRNLQMRGSACQ
jgi:hypothetical protein